MENDKQAHKHFP